jgi:hypothetical protein
MRDIFAPEAKNEARCGRVNHFPQGFERDIFDAAHGNFAQLERRCRQEHCVVVVLALEAVLENGDSPSVFGFAQRLHG